MWPSPKDRVVDQWPGPLPRPVLPQPIPYPPSGELAAAAPAPYQQGNAWAPWSSTEALAFSGVPVSCTPDADWAAAYAQERLFHNITLTQGQNADDIQPVMKDGKPSFLLPLRAMALVEGRGVARGAKDEYIGAAGEADLPTLSSLGYKVGSVRPEVYVGTTFEGKAHGDDRECPIALPYQLSDLPDNLFLAPESEYDAMRKQDSARLTTVLGNYARGRVEAFRNMTFQ